MQVTKTSNKIIEKIKELLGTVLGAAIMAIGISLFLLPNQLSTGGFSGLATITYILSLRNAIWDHGFKY